MRLRLRFLRRSELIQESLRADGWQLVRQRDNQVTAEHPLVKDEATARIRLQDLGLLTSASIQIEFVRLKSPPLIHDLRQKKRNAWTSTSQHCSLNPR